MYSPHTIILEKVFVLLFFILILFKSAGLLLFYLYPCSINVIDYLQSGNCIFSQGAINYLAILSSDHLFLGAISSHTKQKFTGLLPTCVVEWGIISWCVRTCIFIFKKLISSILGYLRHSVNTPGPSQCPYTKYLFLIDSYESVDGLARLHTNLHNYKLHILQSNF